MGNRYPNLDICIILEYLKMISILSIVHRQIELKQNSRGMPVHDR